MVAVAEKKPDTGIGPRLRTLREAADLTQTELGDRAGMQYHNVARLERGDREPTWGTIIKLADALGVRLDEFRVGDDPATGDASLVEDEPEPPVPPRAVGKRK